MATNGHNEEIQNQCPICHNEIANRALTDTCLHEFCFHCLLESSHHNNRCPHCRREYSHIIHNIVSETQFSQTPISDPNVNPMALMSIVVNTRIISLRERLRLERQRLTSEAIPLRHLVRNGRISDTQRTALNTIERTLRLISETMVTLDEISRDLESGVFTRSPTLHPIYDPYNALNYAPVLPDLPEVVEEFETESDNSVDTRQPSDEQFEDIEEETDDSDETDSVRSMDSTLRRTSSSSSITSLALIGPNDEERDDKPVVSSNGKNESNRQISDERNDDKH